MTNYTVLVSLDDGRTWVRHPEEVEASTHTAAAEAIRKKSPELHADERAQFYATPSSRFKPLRKRKQMVEAWRWGDAEPAGGQTEIPT
jgi:hypothetical protein